MTLTTIIVVLGAISALFAVLLIIGLAKAADKPWPTAPGLHANRSGQDYEND